MVHIAAIRWFLLGALAGSVGAGRILLMPMPVGSHLMNFIQVGPIIGSYRQILENFIASLEDSMSGDWWKYMKSLMDLSASENSAMQGLANKHTEGDMDNLVNRLSK